MSLQKSLYPVENADIILAYLSQKVERLLAAMADHLGQADQQWLVGSCCSVADIALYAYVHEAEAGGFTVAQPIQSWLARCEALLGWVSVTDAMKRNAPGSLKAGDYCPSGFRFKIGQFFGCAVPPEGRIPRRISAELGDDISVLVEML